MEKHAQTLPQDVGQLQEIIFSLQEKLVHHQHKQTQLESTLQEKIDEIADLRFKLQKALMARFGRRTEKFDDAKQLNLFDEPEAPSETETQAIQSAEEEIAIASYTRKKTGRKPLPADLPREKIIHDLPETEKICACGCALQRIGEDVSEKLEFIPAQVKVIQHIRCKYACRTCEGAVKMAALPSQPIPKSIASPGLLSHVLVSKYADHLPLYRQEQLLQRMGIDIPRATLCFWVLRCAQLLNPLVEMMKENIIQSTYVQADETSVQVMNEPDKPNTSKSYMWVYHGGQNNQKAIVYEYQETRAGSAAVDFLADFSGVLQTDGYSGYHAFEHNKNVVQAGCWAHCRRKFAEIVKLSKTPGKAHEALQFIRKLYGIEKEARENHLTHELRKILRQQQAKPVLMEFKQWLETTFGCVPPQTHIGKAIAYTLNQWHMLMTYIDYGEIEIDNNLIENYIRPFALGRKNWLFMGNPSGAKAAAVIYSLLVTCKVHLIEPYAYFKYVLDQLPKCKTNEDRKKLLPYTVDFAQLIPAYSKSTWDN